MDLESLKYPIGQYSPLSEVAESDIKGWVKSIEELPSKLSESVKGLSVEELNWVYRPGGWSVKQVVHHLADSHMNSFIRFKLAMTEEVPTIRTYLEGKWAELPDANNHRVELSLNILDGIHNRMKLLFQNLTKEDWARTFFHPEYEKEIRLDWTLGLYAWHSNHHLAHVKQAIEHRGEFD